VSKWTWETLTKHEPELLALEQQAYRLYHSHRTMGWQTVLAGLCRLVGPIADNAALKDKGAYEAARARLQAIFLTGEPMQRVRTCEWEQDDAASICKGERVLPAQAAKFGCPEPEQLATELVSEASTNQRGHGRKEGLPVSGLVSGGLSQTPNQARTQTEGHAPYSGSSAATSST
jgi:hypothetical protein